MILGEVRRFCGIIMPSGSAALCVILLTRPLCQGTAYKASRKRANDHEIAQEIGISGEDITYA